MTDCYICGHLILEGQKKVQVPVSNHDSHLNSADHLPTLPALSHQEIIRNTVQAVERERAARIITDWFESEFPQEPPHVHVLAATIYGLAQRIRGDE